MTKGSKDTKPSAPCLTLDPGDNPVRADSDLWVNFSSTGKSRGQAPKIYTGEVCVKSTRFLRQTSHSLCPTNAEMGRIRNTGDLRKQSTDKVRPPTKMVALVFESAAGSSYLALTNAWGTLEAAPWTILVSAAQRFAHA